MRATAMRIESEFEDPRASRIQVTDGNGETVVRVPPVRNGFVLAFVFVWLCGWTFGGVQAAGQLASGSVQGAAKGFLAFWLCAWLLGWCGAAGLLLWQLFGSEFLVATRSSLTHFYKVLFWSRNRKFNPASITKLRWNEGSGSQWSRYGKYSSVSFDYGAKTINVARGTDSGEGEFIVSLLRKRLGFDKRTPPNAPDTGKGES